MSADIREMSEEAQMSLIEFHSQAKRLVWRGRLTQREADRRLARQRAIVMALKDLEEILESPSDARRRVAVIRLFTRINPEATPQQVELMLEPITQEARAS